LAIRIGAVRNGLTLIIKKRLPIWAFQKRQLQIKIVDSPAAFGITFAGSLILSWLLQQLITRKLTANLNALIRRLFMHYNALLLASSISPNGKTSYLRFPSS